MQATRIPSEFSDRVSAIALDRARRAAQRARARAQLRLGFIARKDQNAPPPPLARMLRGGRGGQVRLKLLLSFLWMQTDEHGVPLAYPAQAWAQLLDLDQTAVAGGRRIQQAQAWLEKHCFISVEAKPGHANRVTLLNETGNGAPYIAPGAAANALRGKPEGAEHRYVQIPAELWTNGYLALLSGAGLALYLVLLDQRGIGEPSSEPSTVWFSPSVLTARYALSDDTRAKGIRDLRDLGLISVSRQAVNPDDFDIERVRNVYTLQPDTLKIPAKRFVTTSYEDRVMRALSRAGVSIDPDHRAADHGLDFIADTPAGPLGVVIKHLTRERLRLRDVLVAEAIAKSEGFQGGLLFITNAPLADDLRAYNSEHTASQHAFEFVAWHDESDDDLLTRAIARNARQQVP